MIDFLIKQPLLVLFIIAALGYPLGRLKIKGFSLGIAAVLFVGLAIGALDERLALPQSLTMLGLVLFVYTVGLASGPSFVASFKRQGLRDNAFVLLMLCAAALTVFLIQRVLGLSAGVSAGLFAGSLTNTPALAAVLELLAEQPETVQVEPVVAYALTYPLAVVGVIVVLKFCEHLFKIDYSQEAQLLRDLGATGEHLHNITVRISRPDIAEIAAEGWREQQSWDVLFGRFRRAGHTDLVHPYTVLQPGDLLSLIGSEAAVYQAATFLGEVTDVHLEFDRSELDYRRMFVSNPEVADKTLAELKLPQRYDVLITRIRRGDSELLPHGRTRLELGDRVRVIARREQMPEITRLFGDSYRALSEIDIMAFSLGICGGLVLGLLPLPLPGGMTFQLGLAGGPLVVALVLGVLGRSGPIVWQLPYSANLTLRQIGLVLFLAGVGSRSGYAFVQTLFTASGLAILLAGLALTVLIALLTLIIGYRLFKIPMSLLAGMLAGLQTQPAVLAYASERSGNDLPNVGYATVFPLATISKIVLAQLLLNLLG